MVAGDWLRRHPGDVTRVVTGDVTRVVTRDVTATPSLAVPLNTGTRQMLSDMHE